MTQFDDRERAFEKKFQLDEEQKFRSSVRAARLFGSWAAGQMGLSGSEAKLYASQLSEIAVAKPGPEPLIKRVEQDFHAKGLSVTQHRLEKELNDCHSESHKQFAG